MIPKEIGHVIKFPKTLSGLFQRACWEIPEIVASTACALIGISLACVAMYNYEKNSGDRRTYKNIYIVVRPDDPRAKLLKDPVETTYDVKGTKGKQRKGDNKQ